MPKHTSAIAKNTLQLFRNTRKIRKIKPGWAAGFATARIEDKKPSVAGAWKLQKAQSEIRRYGIAKDKAENIKDQASGHAWFEDGKLWLAMQKGSFANARKVMQEYFRFLKVSPPPIMEGEPISPDRLGSIEAEDDAALEALASSEESDEEISTATGSEPESDGTPPAANETGDDDRSEPDEPAQPPSPGQRQADPEEILPQEQARAARDQVQKVAAVVQSALSRIAGEQLRDPAGMAQRMHDRLTKRLAISDEGERKALMETAPGRLLMETSRNAVLGWLDRGDISDILDDYPASTAITCEEVVDHFVGIGTHVLHSAKREAQISRLRIQERVAGLFDDGAAADHKFASLERLSKVMLPVIADAERLEKLFGIVPPKSVEDLPMTAIGTADITGTLFQAIGQINACRTAHADAKQGEAGNGLSPEEQDFFDNLIDDLSERTESFLNEAQNLARRIEKAETISAEDIKKVTDRAQNLHSYVGTAFNGTDNCPAEYSPTSVHKLFGESLGAFVAQAQKAA